MSDVPASVRREAIVLARRKKARSVHFTREAPCEWRPMTVTNLEDGNPFTPDAAWEFVAQSLEDASQSIHWVELSKPPGKKALVMIVPYGGRQVYVKFQLGAGTIQGRSFHYSTCRESSAGNPHNGIA